MSGISASRVNNVALPTKAEAPAEKPKTEAPKTSQDITITVKKDNLKLLGEGALAGSVPGAGILFLGAEMAKSAAKMGDGGLGLGLLSLSAKPVAAGVVVAGGAAALLAQGSVGKGIGVGAVASGGTAAAVTFALTKNPALTGVSFVAGAIAGAATGGATAHFIGK